MDDTKLAALLSSRLCHDLIGPIGAINNGVELLVDEDDPAMKEQALQLVSDSAVEASHRLQFYRLAFGAASGLGAEIGLGEANRATEGMFTRSKIRVVWPPDDGVPMDKTVVKLLLNLVLVGAAALARGGTLAVSVSRQAGTLRLAVSASGDRARIGEVPATALRGELDESAVDAHNIQPWYTARLASVVGADLAIHAPAEGQVTLSASL